ncbi:hypothetical protein PHYC_01806 [Phycisphaerales bacterium]|nr:hypothetical protein PHYC_01806 [Phycisphaerales bacterium]
MLLDAPQTHVPCPVESSSAPCFQRSKDCTGADRAVFASDGRGVYNLSAASFPNAALAWLRVSTAAFIPARIVDLSLDEFAFAMTH